MFLRDTLDRAAAEVDAEIGERAQYSGISPASVLVGYPHHELRDLDLGSRPARSMATAKGPFPSEQFTMPAQERGRSDDRIDVAQRLSPKGLRRSSQCPARGVSKENSPATEAATQSAVLSL